MPKIAHIISSGPELSDCQRRVLEFLENHPDCVFRMHNDDLTEIQFWLTEPNAPEPPKMVHESQLIPLGTLRWVFSTLHARDKIGSIVLHRRKYYGSHNTVRRASEMAEQQTKSD